MRFSLDTNVIISHFKADKFSDLAVNDIEVKHLSGTISKRAGELYAKHLLKSKKKGFKRILPDFLIGAHAEQYSDIFVTWNPSDYDIHIAVRTPLDAMGS